MQYTPPLMSSQNLSQAKVHAGKKSFLDEISMNHCDSSGRWVVDLRRTNERDLKCLYNNQGVLLARLYRDSGRVEIRGEKDPGMVILLSEDVTHLVIASSGPVVLFPTKKQLSCVTVSAPSVTVWENLFARTAKFIAECFESVIKTNIVFERADVRASKVQIKGKFTVQKTLRCEVNNQWRCETQSVIQLPSQGDCRIRKLFIHQGASLQHANAPGLKQRFRLRLDEMVNFGRWNCVDAEVYVFKSLRQRAFAAFERAKLVADGLTVNGGTQFTESHLICNSLHSYARIDMSHSKLEGQCWLQQEGEVTVKDKSKISLAELNCYHSSGVVRSQRSHWRVHHCQSYAIWKISQSTLEFDQASFHNHSLQFASDSSLRVHGNAIFSSGLKCTTAETQAAVYCLRAGRLRVNGSLKLLGSKSNPIKVKVTNECVVDSSKVKVSEVRIDAPKLVMRNDPSGRHLLSHVNVTNCNEFYSQGAWEWQCSQIIAQLGNDQALFVVKGSLRLLQSLMYSDGILVQLSQQHQSSGVTAGGVDCVAGDLNVRQSLFMNGFLKLHNAYCFVDRMHAMQSEFDFNHSMASAADWASDASKIMLEDQSRIKSQQFYHNGPIAMDASSSMGSAGVHAAGELRSDHAQMSSHTGVMLHGGEANKLLLQARSCELKKEFSVTDADFTIADRFLAVDPMQQSFSRVVVRAKEITLAGEHTWQRVKWLAGERFSASGVDCETTLDNLIYSDGNLEITKSSITASDPSWLPPTKAVASTANIKASSSQSQLLLSSKGCTVLHSAKLRCGQEFRSKAGHFQCSDSDFNGMLIDIQADSVSRKQSKFKADKIYVRTDGCHMHWIVRCKTSADTIVYSGNVITLLSRTSAASLYQATGWVHLDFLGLRLAQNSQVSALVNLNASLVLPSLSAWSFAKLGLQTLFSFAGMALNICLPHVGVLYSGGKMLLRILSLFSTIPHEMQRLSGDLHAHEYLPAALLAKSIIQSIVGFAGLSGHFDLPGLMPELASGGEMAGASFGDFWSSVDVMGAVQLGLAATSGCHMNNSLLDVNLGGALAPTQINTSLLRVNVGASHAVFSDISTSLCDVNLGYRGAGWERITTLQHQNFGAEVGLNSLAMSAKTIKNNQSGFMWGRQASIQAHDFDQSGYLNLSKGMVRVNRFTDVETSQTRFDLVNFDAKKTQVFGSMSASRTLIQAHDFDLSGCLNLSKGAVRVNRFTDVETSQTRFESVDFYADQLEVFGEWRAQSLILESKNMEIAEQSKIHLSDAILRAETFVDASTLNYSGVVVIDSDNYCHQGHIQYEGEDEPNQMVIRARHAALNGTAEIANGTIDIESIEDGSAFVSGEGDYANYHFDQSLTYICDQDLSFSGTLHRSCDLDISAKSIDWDIAIDDHRSLGLHATDGDVSITADLQLRQLIIESVQSVLVNHDIDVDQQIVINCEGVFINMGADITASDCAIIAAEIRNLTKDSDVPSQSFIINGRRFDFDNNNSEAFFAAGPVLMAGPVITSVEHRSPHDPISRRASPTDFPNAPVNGSSQPIAILRHRTPGEELLLMAGPVMTLVEHCSPDDPHSLRATPTEFPHTPVEGPLRPVAIPSQGPHGHDDVTQQLPQRLNPKAPPWLPSTPLHQHSHPNGPLLMAGPVMTSVEHGLPHDPHVLRAAPTDFPNVPVNGPSQPVAILRRRSPGEEPLLVAGPVMTPVEHGLPHDPHALRAAPTDFLNVPVNGSSQPIAILRRRTPGEEPLLMAGPVMTPVEHGLPHDPHALRAAPTDFPNIPVKGPSQIAMLRHRTPGEEPLLMAGPVMTPVEHGLPHDPHALRATPTEFPHTPVAGPLRPMAIPQPGPYSNGKVAQQLPQRLNPKAPPWFPSTPLHEYSHPNGPLQPVAIPSQGPYGHNNVTQQLPQRLNPKAPPWFPSTPLHEYSHPNGPLQPVAIPLQGPYGHNNVTQQLPQRLNPEAPPWLPNTSLHQYSHPDGPLLMAGPVMTLVDHSSPHDPHALRATPIDFSHVPVADPLQPMAIPQPGPHGHGEVTPQLPRSLNPKASRYFHAGSGFPLFYSPFFQSHPQSHSSDMGDGGSISASHHLYLNATKGNIENQGGIMQGGDGAQLIARRDIVNRCGQYNASQGQFTHGVIAGGDAQDSSGVGLYMQAGGRVVGTGSDFLSDADIVMHGKEGVVLNAATHTTTSTTTRKHGVFGKKKQSTSSSTMVQGCSVQSASGVNVIYSEKGDVIARAATIAGASGNILKAGRDVSIKSVITNSTTHAKKTGHLGVYSKSHSEQHQQSHASVVVGGGMLVIDSGRNMTLQGAEVMSAGDASIHAGGVMEFRRDVLNHSQQDKSSKLKINVPGADVYRAYQRDHQCGDALEALDPVVAKTRAVKRAGSDLERGTALFNATVEYANTANNLMRGIANDQCGAEVMARYGLGGSEGFNPGVSMTWERQRTEHHYQTLGCGGVSVAGKLTAHAEGGMHLENGICVDVRGDVVITTPEMVVSGAQLASDYRQHDQSVSLHGTPMGGVDSASVSDSRYHSHATQVVNSRIQSGGHMSIHNGDQNGTALTMLGGCFSADTFDGHFSDVHMESLSNTEQHSGRSYGGSTAGQVNIQVQQGESSQVDEVTGVFTRGDNHIRCDKFFGKGVELSSSEGTLNIEAQSLKTESITEFKHEKGWGVQTNVSDVISKATGQDPSNQAGENAIATIGVSVDRDHETGRLVTKMHGQNGTSIMAQEQCGELQTSGDSARRIESSSSTHWQLDVPVTNSAQMQQAKENFEHGAEKISERFEKMRHRFFSSADEPNESLDASDGAWDQFSEIMQSFDRCVADADSEALQDAVDAILQGGADDPETMAKLESALQDLVAHSTETAVTEKLTSVIEKLGGGAAGKLHLAKLEYLLRLYSNAASGDQQAFRNAGIDTVDGVLQGEFCGLLSASGPGLAACLSLMVIPEWYDSHFYDAHRQESRQHEIMQHYKNVSSEIQSGHYGAAYLESSVARTLLEQNVISEILHRISQWTHPVRSTFANNP